MKRSQKSVLGIIPARYDSTRLPGKPLAMIGSRSMVMRVYAQALQARNLDHLYVATDDVRILRHVTEAGGKALMTRKTHPSGTSRCLEALEQLEQQGNHIFDVVINIQGDEPFLDPGEIEKLIAAYEQGFEGIASLCTPIREETELFNPNVVKVVLDAQGKALYFSRQPIPYLTGRETKEWASAGLYRRHIGVYAFSVLSLRQTASLQPDRNEMAESLEQLRWLAAGIPIRMLESESLSQGIDCEQDLARARKRVETEE
jgi:3-deoxy-manno-octulosonate cytidylyltransferase (CMP-KDO synthetase)